MNSLWDGCNPDHLMAVFVSSQVLLHLRDAHASSLLPLLWLQSVRATARSPLCVFWPVCGFPKLPLLPELLAVHVDWAPVRYSHERRGFHCHIKGRCDSAQRPAAAYTLDYANLR